MSEGAAAGRGWWPRGRRRGPEAHARPALQRESTHLTFRAAPPAWLVLPTLAGGLWIDQAFELIGQLVTSLWVWTLFLIAAVRSSAAERRLLVKCLWIATAGELLCSLAWGIYDYRLHNVPAFVPPGHVLLLMLGLRAASTWTEARAAWFAAFTVAGMAAAAVRCGDAFSLLLLGVLALLWRWCPAQRRTFAALLPLALCLELLGTSLGNWRWPSEVPGLGLSTHNPPFAASVFYCLLECLVLQLRGERLRAWASAGVGRLAGRARQASTDQARMGTS